MSRQVFGQFADVLLAGADVQNLKGLVCLAVNHLCDGCGTRHMKLKLFTAHGLGQNGQVQLSPSGDHEHVGAVSGLHPQTDVGPQLPNQPFMEISGRAVGPFQSHKRGGVDTEAHPNRWFVDVDGWQGLRMFQGGDGVAD